MVSVVLNCFKRPHSLEDQYKAVVNQTIKPAEILIWKNAGLDIREFNREILDNCSFSDCNKNLGVWGRFAYALNAQNEYILLLDDDTIPGTKWIENCIREFEKRPGIYGTIGVSFLDLDYANYHRDGWANPNEETVSVDIVGHAWFFHRKSLGAFWAEGEKPLSNLCGEDMNLSYTSQKYLGLETFVPPHPMHDIEMWGSMPDRAYELGVDQNAISVQHHGSLFGESLKHYYNKGFKLKNVK